MELLPDRRIRLDPAAQRMLRDLAGMEFGEVVTIDQIRYCVERVDGGSQTHVFANMMRSLMHNLLAEAEALAGDPALVGAGRLH